MKLDGFKNKIAKTLSPILNKLNRRGGSHVDRPDMDGDSGLIEPTGSFERLEKTPKEKIQYFLENGLELGAKFGSRLAEHSTWYSLAISTLLAAWIISDLASLGMSVAIKKYLPTQTTTAKPIASQSPADQMNTDDFKKILARNLFNTIVEVELNSDIDPAGKPVKSSLPFELIGVLLVSDPARSIATLNDKKKNRTVPIRINEEISNVLKVTEITQDRVIFINLEKRRNEYIELPKNHQFKAPVITAGSTDTGSGIKRIAPTKFNIPRSEITAAMGNLDDLLRQARAIPHPDGFRLTQIKPGSVYSKLGLQNGDVINMINGEKADASKAIELMSIIGEMSELELSIKRGGKTENFNYIIN